MEPLITLPLKEWNALHERAERAENEIRQIYSALQPLQPAQNTDEWGMNLVNMLVARLTSLEKIVSAQQGHEDRPAPTAGSDDVID